MSCQGNKKVSDSMITLLVKKITGLLHSKKNSYVAKLRIFDLVA